MQPLIVKPYTGQPLEGDWTITRKLDGVQIIYQDGVATTRGGRVLELAPAMPDGIYELFISNWSRTMIHLNDELLISHHDLYNLQSPSHLIFLSHLVNPSLKDLEYWFNTAIEAGNEGIVISQGNTHYKLKQVETIDLPITKIIEGTGRHKGMAGTVETPMGKVSVGFNTLQRIMLWQNKAAYLGTTIECKYKTISDNEKMIEPRFYRFRPDKERITN